MTISIPTISPTAISAATPPVTDAPEVSPTPRTSRLVHIPPNWFAAVMGTGIVAVAAHGLPWHSAVLDAVAVMFWAMAVVVYVAVLAATVAHWVRHPHLARAHHRHPVTAHFYGSVPMATLTVGSSTILAGSSVIGHAAALAVGVGCFVLGSAGGVCTAVVIPATRIVGRAATRGPAFGGWLMSVVPPMVAASAAAVLAAELAPGRLRSVVLIAGLAMFALSLTCSTPVIVAIVARLRTGDVGPAATVPTWWIVLGPLGQSVTAVCLLARDAGGPRATGLPRELALGFALPVWIGALGWIVVAVTITARTLREGLPFGLTWWSFTFPVGTFVTGSSALAVITGSTVFSVSAAIALVALLGAWTVVAVRTVLGILDGSVLQPA